MYRLTPRMEQHFRQSLATFHRLFDGNRCSGWQLEEMLVRAIRSDTSSNPSLEWVEGGHDDKADICIVNDGQTHLMQIKSGKCTKNKKTGAWLTLSGHRFGRYKGDFGKISDYLNNMTSDIIAVPYRKHEGPEGRQHIYRICYIPVALIKGVKEVKWKKVKEQYVTKNDHGVMFSLHPSLSWQIWWKIPLPVIDELGREFADGRFIDDSNHSRSE